MSNCTKCDKMKISPDQRCDCRLDWQINKCFVLESQLKEKDALLNYIIGEIQYAIQGDRKDFMVWQSRRALESILNKDEVKKIMDNKEE